MYERFFHLRERPFALSPDPDYLYPSRVHREALSYLRYGIESQAGFVVITGEIGSGKTTLLQALLRGLDGQTTVIRLMNTLLEPRELLEAIGIDLGFEPRETSKPALLHELAARLVEERTQGRIVLLVIDEAQNLGLPALEEIRMLSNLETEKSKLIQIVLVGQPDLRDKLERSELEQLRQRITVSYHLSPLDADETEAYINHRLRRAALGAPLLFPRDVTARIHTRARGIPRLVNVICDAVLVFAYAEERRIIDRALVEEAFRELEATGVLRPGEGEEAPAPALGQEAIAPAAGEAEAAAEPAHRLSTDAAEATALEEADAATARSQGLIEKEASLRMMEAQLRRREEQLAEQRRVLADEYRLFRDERSPQAPLTGIGRGEASTIGWPPSAPRAHAAAPRPPLRQPVAEPPRVQPRRAVFSTPEWPEPAPPRRRFWQRVKHVLLGVTEPVMEDRS